MTFAKKRSFILLAFTAFLLFLMSAAGFYSIYVTNSISSDAMIINKLGTIRGSMQRAVKLELGGLSCEDTIQKVDGTFEEFQQEKIKLKGRGRDVMDEIQGVEEAWHKLKNSMYDYRKEANERNKQQLLKDSEDAWYKANSMVFASQISSEQKIGKYKLSFIAFFLNILLSLIIIFLIKRYVKDALEEMVHYDSLTHIYNRRFFSEALHSEIIRSERYNKAFSLIMFDIDHFKKINDTYGHDVGDKVLQDLAALVKQCIRKSDLLARVGGEEFAIIVPQTDIESAAFFAEKIRKKVEEGILANNLKITVSLGVGQYQSKDDDNAIYKRADNALYKAKNNGRNRVELESANQAETIA